MSPRFDGTGPQGQGPRTGRGAGPCKKSSEVKVSVGKAPRQGIRMGSGFGQGRGLGRGPGRNKR